jgi:2-polyprenyl-6-methoxyphenol hydroxylase-like FAD-dependent oxidoreductase
LARSLAEEGVDVVVLEATETFTDRVRGEQLHPWGVAELRRLGIYDLLRDSCGHELPWWDVFLGPNQIAHRPLPETTPQAAPELSFYHPAMQEVLLQAARDAGAHVRRGARVTHVEPGPTPRVTVRNGNGQDEVLTARLVVGCDGRASSLRGWCGFEVRKDPTRHRIAGLLVEGAKQPVADCSRIVINPQLGREVALFPQGDGKLRAYLIWPEAEDMRLSGARDVPRFMAESIRTGAPAECFEEATPIGPLATFDATDTWVPHPYANGVVLVGDAAASNDPSYGEGLSLTVRDVRVLRDRLVVESDWEEAGHAYAREHDDYYGVIHQVTGLYSQMFLEQSPEADARRAKALPLIAEDPSRVPDHLVSGPDLPFDEATRGRFFAEDVN